MRKPNKRFAGAAILVILLAFTARQAGAQGAAPEPEHSRLASSAAAQFPCASLTFSRP